MEIKADIWVNDITRNTQGKSSLYNVIITDADLEKLAFEKWLETKSFPENYSCESVIFRDIKL